MTDVPPVTKRENGLEFFDAYWGEGWPDGNVPSTLSGLDGMMTEPTSPARIRNGSRRNTALLTNIMNQSGTMTKSWKTYTKADWDALGVLAADQMGRRRCLRPRSNCRFWVPLGPGSSNYRLLKYSVSNVRIIPTVNAR